MKYLILVLSLMLSTSAFAVGEWSRLPDETVTAGSQVRFLKPIDQGGQWRAFYDFNNTQDSLKLDINACDVVHLHFDPDEDGTNTGATVQIYLDHEPGGGDAGSANSSMKVLNGAGDVTLTGDETTGRASITDIPGSGYLWVDVTANGSSDDARVWVTCHD